MLYYTLVSFLIISHLYSILFFTQLPIYSKQNQTPKINIMYMNKLQTKKQKTKNKKQKTKQITKKHKIYIHNSKIGEIRTL